MKRYTKYEILEILESTDKERILSYRTDRERVLANPLLKDRLADILREAEKMDAIPTPTLPFSSFKRYEIDGDRYEYEGDYFLRRRKLEAFAIRAWLYEREEDVSALEDIIWAVLDEYTWALPAHLWGEGLKKIQADAYMVDLFAAETAETLSEILVLVGDKLQPIVAERTRRLIRERVLDRMNERFRWMNWSNNWVAVCGGSVGIASMYESDDEQLASILYTVIDSLHRYLDGFSDDGACLEGIAYWRYGFGYFIAFSELLYRRTEGKINLFHDEKVHKVASFIQKCIFPGGKCVSFSDGHSSATISLFATAKLSEIYPDIPLPSLDTVTMRYPEDVDGRFALELRNLIWAPNALPTDGGCFATHVLEAAEWYISTAKNGTSLAAKAGHNDEPHNHNDVGSFEIYKNGEELLCDLGCGAYNKAYFDPKTRYGVLCNASYGHSLPIINGTYQLPGKEFAAREVKIDTTGIRMDMSGAYNIPTLDSLIRDVRFDAESGAVTLTDTYSFTESLDEVLERFITRTIPEIDGGTVMIKSGNEVLSIAYPDTVTPSVVEFDHCIHSGDWVKIYAIDFKLTTSEKQFTLKFEMR